MERVLTNRNTRKNIRNKPFSRKQLNKRYLNLLKKKQEPSDKRVKEQKNIEEKIIKRPNEYDVLKNKEGNIINIKKIKLNALIETGDKGTKVGNIIQKEYIYDQGKLKQIREYKQYPYVYQHSKSGTRQINKNEIESIINIDYSKNKKTIINYSDVNKQKQLESNSYQSIKRKRQQINKLPKKKEVFTIVKGKVKIEDEKGNIRNPKKEELSQAIKFSRMKSDLLKTTQREVIQKPEKSFLDSKEYKDSLINNYLVDKRFQKVERNIVPIRNKENEIIGYTDNINKKSVMANKGQTLKEEDIKQLNYLTGVVENEKKKLKTIKERKENLIEQSFKTPILGNNKIRELIRISKKLGITTDNINKLNPIKVINLYKEIMNKIDKKIGKSFYYKIPENNNIGGFLDSTYHKIDKFTFDLLNKTNKINSTDYLKGKDYKDLLRRSSFNETLIGKINILKESINRTKDIKNKSNLQIKLNNLEKQKEERLNSTFSERTIFVFI